MTGGPIEPYLRRFPPAIQQLTHALRRIVRTTLPAAAERLYPGWQIIGYRIPTKSGSAYIGFLAPAESHVKLGFEHGVLLADPDGVLTGSGTQVRSIVIRQGETLRPEVIIPLLLQAAELATRRTSPSSTRRTTGRRS